MTTRKKMKFRTKLTLLFLFIAIIPLAILGYLNFNSTSEIMEKGAIDQLISLREDRKAQLQDFFKSLKLNIEMLSDHRLLKDILSEYIAAYDNGGFEGEKFKEIDKRYHKRCAWISEKYGYEDMLLVNNDGDVLITVKKREDWGTNLINGIYSDTNLAECFKNSKKGTHIVDFKQYPPLGRPAAFIGAPMIRREERRGFKAEEKIGVLMVQIPVDQINKVMMRKEGLGNTGETFLIGKDLFMRSDSRFFNESSILKIKAKSAAVREAIEGISGYKKNVIDYRGKSVSVAYAPAEIEGFDWAVIAEKDRKEILNPINILKNQNIIIMLLVFMGLVLADFLFVAGIRKPLKRIIEAGDKMAAGDLGVRVPVETRGDIGNLAVCLNHMAQNLMESRKKIESYSQLLEKKVEIRTKALNKKNLRLEQSNNTQKAHNEIVEALNKELEIEPLLKNMIGKIAGHTSSQLGVIYVYEEDSKSLHPLSSYAVDREFLGDGFSLGSGLPGQSALEKKTILITDVPESYLRISSGSIEGLPKNVICMPITIKDQLVGVLELASFHEYTDKNIKFLETVTYQLGIGMNNSLVYLRLEKMAEDLKNKNEVMAAHNEELQAQNEEIQAQSEEIQAQSEVLITQKKEIEEKSEQVKEASQLKSEFLSNMSHELRTPLNSMLGLTNLMAKEVAGHINEKQRGYIEIVERNGKNLLQLINDILDLSKIESGKVDMSISRIHLKKFITDVSISIMPLIDRKGLFFKIDIDDDIFTYSDVDKLRQILINLIGNAAKFTQKGGVRVSAVFEKGNIYDRVIIKVSDTGIGIPADALEYIFEPFRQVDGSLTRKYDGTGLGLNICYNLLKLMHGKIKVESEVGKGSTFTITLLKDRRSKLRPKEEDWKRKVKHALVNETRKELPDPGNKAKKILIIDDDPIIIKEMEIIFKEENYCLTSALTGLEGLSLLSKYLPDMILLDLRMPDMDGFQVLNELQKREELKDLPVIILTAADLTEDEKKSLGKNVKEVVLKGQIDKNTLFSVINKILYVETGAGDAMVSKHAEEKTKEPDKPNKPDKLKKLKKLKKPDHAKILIVEDNSDNMMLFKEILRPLDCRIYMAKNGQEAIDMAPKDVPDLILMDMQMPVMNGFDSTRHMRTIQTLKDIPIIGLTAKAMKGDKKRVIEAGCSDYLSKPVMPDNLLDKVEEWLHKIPEN